MKFKFSLFFALILLTGLAIFSYIFIKASVSSFTIDESFTYNNYVHTPFIDILSYKCWYTNNHLLNTLFMKYSEKLFGSSETALRLPNLLLFAVYMIYSFLLFKRSNKFLALAIFVLLCTNNAMIDLFGLARGYGMSYGFMLMSLYHFIQSFYGHRTRNIVLFHTGAALAVLSNFTLLDFYLALLLIWFIMIFIDCVIISEKKFPFLDSIKVHVIPLLLVVLVLYEPVRRVIMNSNLNFGGKTGFYADTVTHFIIYAFHGLDFSPALGIILKIVFTSIVLIPTVIIVWKIIRRDATFFNNHKGLIISNLLVLLISLAIFFQHVVFKMDYPILRFSLYLFPIYMVHFGFFLAYLCDHYKKTVTVTALSLALISGVSFVLKTDLYSCSEWQFDTETKHAVQNLIKYHNEKDPYSRNVKMGVNWLFESTTNFYRETKHINWLLPVDRKGIYANDDYDYILLKDLNQFKPNDCEVISVFESTNSVLLKNIKGHK